MSNPTLTDIKDFLKKRIAEQSAAAQKWNGTKKGDAEVGQLYAFSEVVGYVEALED